MTRTNDAPPSGHGLDGFYEALRRPGIVRASDHRWFAGVATGLARRAGVDPLVVRAGFILLSMFFGVGVGLYLVLWLLMPDDRGNLSIERALKYGDGHSIFLLVVTALAVLGGGPWWDGDTHGMRFGGYVLLGVAAWWFLTRTDTGRGLVGSWSRQSQGSGEHAGSTSAAAGVSTGNAAANAGAGLSAPPRPAPVPVPVPPRERTPVIGFAAGLLVLGLAVITAAALTAVAHSAGWAGNPLAVGVASGLGVLGLGILVAGIAGRRAGGLAPFAVLGMMAAAFTTVVPAGLSQPWQVGERQVAVTDLGQTAPYQLGLGQLTLDLTSADFAKTPTTPDVVRTSIGMGELDIVVPENVVVVVHAKARAGELAAYGHTGSGSDMGSMMDGSPSLQRSGAGLDETVRFGPATGTEQIRVEAEVGLGQITITRSAS